MKRRDFLEFVGKGFLGGAALLTGCSNLLNQTNPNNLTPNTFYKTSSDAEASVASIYQVFSGQVGWAQGNNIWWRIEAFAFQTDTNGLIHDVPANYAQALFNLDSTNGNVAALWDVNYTGIFRANQSIANIPGIQNMDPTLRARLVGEAKFLRAYFYFSQITAFNNVALRLTVPQSSKDYPMAFATPAETWAQIEKDLTDAAAVLPWSYDAADIARVTKGAALGFLGKSYLYQGKWQQATDTFQQIINSNNYQLMSNFWDVFKTENDFHNESLLEVNYTTTPQGGQQFASWREHIEAPSEVGGWYQEFPSQFTFDELTKETLTGGAYDPRLYGTIVFNNNTETYWGKKYSDWFPNETQVPGKMAWMKYSAAEYDHPLGNGFGKNWRVLRYSDILLMNAEALANLSKVTDAVNNVNLVRNRAQLSSIPASMTKSQVLTEIEHQRICELSDEGFRWFDLVRWQGNITGTLTLKQVLKAHGQVGADNFQAPKNYYYPIPLAELQTNPKAKQNPGY